MEDEPEQDALFYLEGPDDDGCVWNASAKAGVSALDPKPTLAAQILLSKKSG